MSSDYFVLEGKIPVQLSDSEEGLMEWARWMGKNRDSRRVALSEKDGIRVSTVFLGINHQFSDDGPPLLFETMIFGGPHNDYQERCSTWVEAEEMHKRACALAGIEEGEIKIDKLG